MVTVVYRDKSWKARPGSTVRHIILSAGLNPESMLAVRQGKLIHEATLIRNGDVIKLIGVVWGG